MSFRVRILPRAANDLDRTISWIEKRSVEGAKRWFSAFDAAVNRVLRNPESYSYAAENDDLDMELREFQFKTRKGKVYRAVFQIRDDEVCILRIRGPGQADITESDL
jgi:plasmid stabilization system protein ParE